MTCRPIWNEELKDIFLINVETRRLVRYPPKPCQYLTLSYLWGHIYQHSPQVGARLGSLPQTIEDAVTFTLLLGKRYLWVNSVFINQSNEAERHKQIARMSIIYRGADATFVALSGKDAQAGFPKLSWRCAVFPQLKCCVDGKRLVGLLPTLWQQVWFSTWGPRA